MRDLMIKIHTPKTLICDTLSSINTLELTDMTTLFPIPAFHDNYIWALVNDQNQAIIVDPGDATPVLEYLKRNQLSLSAILLTHHHMDHVGGVPALLSVHPDVAVFSQTIGLSSLVIQKVSDNQQFTIHQYEFRVIAIPGHTLDHVAYYCPPFLFCGDTLFTNGCGRLFEGTAAQMLASLKKLMRLPDETQICCGHEYTLSNIQFALQVEPSNRMLKKRHEDTKRLRTQQKPTVPATLALEKATNPFLRCHEHTVIEAVSQHTGHKLIEEEAVFAALRQWKNAC